MGVGFSGILFLLWLPLVVVIAIWSVRTVLAAVRVPRKAGGAGGAASCGRCGYEIAHLGTDRCSECGAPLLRAGVVTPALALRLRGSLFGALVAWTVLMLAIVMTLSPFVAFFVRQAGTAPVGRAVYSLTETWAPVRTPGSAAAREAPVYTIRIQADGGIQQNGPMTSGGIDISLTTPDGAAAGAGVSIGAGGTYTLRDANGMILSGTEGDSFDAEAAMRLYEQAGLDARTNDALRAEAAQLASIVNEVQLAPQSVPMSAAARPQSSTVGLQSQGSATSLSSGAAPGGLVWIMPAFALLLLLIWIAGLILIPIKRRRALQRADAEPAPA